LKAWAVPLIVLSLAPGCALLVGLEDKELGLPDAAPPDGGTPDTGATLEDAGATLETIATQQDRPMDLAVDATHVYWINEGGQLQRRGKGSAAVPETMATGLSAPRWIAVDGQYAFWCAANTPERRNDAGILSSQILIGRVDKARPGQPEAISSGALSGFRLLALFDGYKTDADAGTLPDRFLFSAYSQASNSDSIRRYFRAGGDEAVQANNQDGVSAMTVDETNVYWAVRQSRTLRGRSKLDGNPAPTNFATLPDIATDLAVDPTHVYALLASGAVYRMPKAPPNTLELVAQGPAGGQRLALDGTEVYFTVAIEGDPDGRVYTAPKMPSGKPPTLLADRQGEPRGIAVDQDPVSKKKSVYFVARSEGAVKRVSVR
jgi:hypothetical protein